jgi:hypothetical protein
MWPMIAGIGMNFFTALFGGPKKPAQWAVDYVNQQASQSTQETMVKYYLPAGMVLLGGLLIFMDRK